MKPIWIMILLAGCSTPPTKYCPECEKCPEPPRATLMELFDACSKSCGGKIDHFSSEYINGVSCSCRGTR